MTLFNWVKSINDFFSVDYSKDQKIFKKLKKSSYSNVFNIFFDFLNNFNEKLNE